MESINEIDRLLSSYDLMHSEHFIDLFEPHIFICV